jgi:hypothetical protein
VGELVDEKCQIIREVIAFLILVEGDDQIHHKYARYRELLSGKRAVAAQKNVSHRNVIRKDDVSEERRSTTIEADQKRTLTAHEANSGRPHLA